MRATICNISSLPRDHWGVVTFPRVLAGAFGQEATFRVDDGRRWRAVRGRDVGMKATYRIHATMEGHERVEGTLRNEVHAEAAPLAYHPWCADDIHELIPTVGARRNGIDKWAGDLTSFVMVDSSPAHQRWTLTRRIPEFGVYFVWWADVLHLDPVMPCWGKIVWSDRTDPNHNCKFDALGIKAGEFFALDFAKRHGALDPTPLGRDWWSVFGGPFTLNDGAGLPISGAMLAHASVDESEDVGDPEDFNHPVQRSMANLYAGMEGPIVGVSHDWDGHFLSCRNAPRTGPKYQSECNRDWQKFVAGEEVPVGWFAPRPVGIGTKPFQTGNQEDFGATKGTYMVTDLDPRHLRRFQYSVYSELFRGYNHYEVDGAPLDPDDHPDWVTWSGVTHWHKGVSKDRLGKSTEGWTPPPGTGWYGYDDQHRSQNGQAAYMLLTDDPLMEDQVAHVITTDRASYRLRLDKGRGAARAQGRHTGAWAQLLATVDGQSATHLAQMIEARLQLSSAAPNLAVQGPMKVLAWGKPDDRKPIVDAQMNPGRWAAMWEHGLALVGIYNAIKADGTNQTHRQMLTIVCETIAEFGCFEENGKWFTVDEVLWSDGEPPPGGLRFASPHLTSKPGARGVGSWTFAGILVAREVLGDHHKLSDKLRRYVHAITGGEEASSRVTAEWWAAVESVKFQMA